METIDLNQTNKLETALWDISGAAAAAEAGLVILDNRLLTLRLSVGKLRASLERAFAPMTAAAAPVLEGAVRRLTDFCDAAGSVMAALFGTVYKKAVTTTKSAGSAIRRTLADFDQLQRLGGGGSGGSSETQVTLQPVNDPLSPQLQGIVDNIQSFMDKVRSLLAPLKTIDFSPAAQAFARLGQAIGQLFSGAAPQLQWLWYNLLVPLGKWIIESAGPASVDLLTAALKALNALFAPMAQGLQQLLAALAPMGELLGSAMVQGIRAAQGAMQALGGVFTGVSGQLRDAFSHVSAGVQGLCEALKPVLGGLQAFWQGTVDAMVTTASGLVNAMSGVTLGLSRIFAGGWQQAWEGAKTALRGAVNSIISLLNGMLSALTAAVNGLGSILSRVSFTVPQWVPGLGGKNFGITIPKVTAPSIPYLAQGAVLPANKPFLAMVGDQRHGTNIEAPLATIQEAVALVMQDQTAAIMAGFTSSVEVQREILQAVLGIRIGDDTIASACDRYRTRLAMQRGV